MNKCAWCRKGICSLKKEPLQFSTMEEWDVAQYTYWPDEKSYHVRHTGLFRPSLGYDQQFADPATHGGNSSLLAVQPSRSAVPSSLEQTYYELFWLTNKPITNRLLKKGEKHSAEELFSIAYGNVWKCECRDFLWRLCCADDCQCPFICLRLSCCE